MELDTRLAERRRTLVERASASNATLAKLFEATPREFGLDVLFYGNRRDVVRAVASSWASRENGTVASVAIGGRSVCEGSTVYVTASPDCIEVDLDSASAAEVRTIMRWLYTRVQSRHVTNARHVVVIHAAEKVLDKSIARLQMLTTTIIVLSTTSVGSQAIASLSGIARIRVPYRDSTPPDSVMLVLEPLVGAMTVQSARDAVNKLARAGFNVAEISQFAWHALSDDAFASASCDARCEALATIAQLAHAAHGVSQLDRRALETLVVAIGAGCSV